MGLTKEVSLRSLKESVFESVFERAFSWKKSKTLWGFGGSNCFFGWGFGGLAWGMAQLSLESLSLSSSPPLSRVSGEEKNWSRGEKEFRKCGVKIQEKLVQAACLIRQCDFLLIGAGFTIFLSFFSSFYLFISLTYFSSSLPSFLFLKTRGWNGNSKWTWNIQRGRGISLASL